ncbi:Heat shock protein DnaJ, cysteine-rich domain superfamily [Sesbania bispinosa]|nr:Heat shock protein DnaJ, cysteine-rich domain superfamily [Sesbania bispinosa]
MVPSLCLTPQSSPSIGIESHSNSRHIRVNYVFQGPPTDKCRFVTAKATPGGNQNTKPNSVICADCDGNGAVLCSQCKGSGVNSVDIFNGQFKAGDSCWLCGGRKEMLCGNCNGAGFIGGFLSTYDQKMWDTIILVIRKG